MKINILFQEITTRTVDIDISLEELGLDESATEEEILSAVDAYANENACDLIPSNDSSIVEESLDVYRIIKKD